MLRISKCDVAEYISFLGPLTSQFWRIWSSIPLIARIHQGVRAKICVSMSAQNVPLDRE
jgi:hypothetical protein